MRSFGCVAAILFCSLLITFTSTALAHDGSWGTEADPCVIDWIGDSTDLDLIHNDMDPWKGWASVTVKNSCSDAWGDFHFRIKDAYPYDYSNVFFHDDAPYQPRLWLWQGSSWVQYTTSWNLAADGLTMNLYFPDNLVEQGDIAKFEVYTDNTATHCDWFKIGVYPTIPVPEPATVALLGLGSIALLRRKKIS